MMTLSTLVYLAIAGFGVFIGSAIVAAVFGKKK
jgi:hypothetical protein